jgi:hypothetical protein
MVKKIGAWLIILTILFLVVLNGSGCRPKEPELDLDEKQVQQAEGIYIGQIDVNLAKIKIDNRLLVFKLDEGVTLEEIPDGSRVAISYIEEEKNDSGESKDTRFLLLSIQAIEVGFEVIEGEGFYIGQIDNLSVEIEIEGKPRAFRLADGVQVEGIENNTKVNIQYRFEDEQFLLLSIKPVEEPIVDENELLVGEGQLIGLIDAQSVEIKINRAFILDPGVSIEDINDGDLVAFKFRESGLQAVIESIRTVEQALEGELMHGTLIGRIDGQSIEIEYFQAFALGSGVSLTGIEDGDDIFFTYLEGEHRPVLISVRTR